MELPDLKNCNSAVVLSNRTWYLSHTFYCSEMCEKSKSSTFDMLWKLDLHNKPHFISTRAWRSQGTLGPWTTLSVLLWQVLGWRRLPGRRSGSLKRRGIHHHHPQSKTKLRKTVCSNEKRIQWKLRQNLRKIVCFSETLQELRMLSSVTINC